MCHGTGKLNTSSVGVGLLAFFFVLRFIFFGGFTTSGSSSDDSSGSGSLSEDSIAIVGFLFLPAFLEVKEGCSTETLRRPLGEGDTIEGLETGLRILWGRLGVAVDWDDIGMTYSGNNIYLNIWKKMPTKMRWGGVIISIIDELNSNEMEWVE